MYHYVDDVVMGYEQINIKILLSISTDVMWMILSVFSTMSLKLYSSFNISVLNMLVLGVERSGKEL